VAGRNPDFPHLTAEDIHRADRMRDEALLHRDETPEADAHERGVTKEDFTSGRVTVVHSNHGCTPEKAERWRVSGKCQTWKRDTERFRQPVKHGLYVNYAITQDNADRFHAAEVCPHGHG